MAKDRSKDEILAAFEAFRAALTEAGYQPEHPVDELQVIFARETDAFATRAPRRYAVANGANVPQFGGFQSASDFVATLNFATAVLSLPRTDS